jgi:phage terminase Nu1 subunit (DNA packaging protein)
MAGNERGQRVNRSQLADVFGVSLPTVDNWVKAGAPVVQRGSRGTEWVFNTADVARWMKDRAVESATGTATADEAELNRRRMRAETERAELALAKDKNQVAPLDQVERMVSRAFSQVRAGMRNIPGRVVAALIGETDERTFKRILLEEIDQVLENLANADLAGSDEDGDEDEDGEGDPD